MSYRYYYNKLNFGKKKLESFVESLIIITIIITIIIIATITTENQ